MTFPDGTLPIDLEQPFMEETVPYHPDVAKLMIQNVFQPWLIAKALKTDLLVAAQETELLLDMVDAKVGSAIFRADQHPQLCARLEAMEMGTKLHEGTGPEGSPFAPTGDRYIIARPYVVLIWNLLQISKGKQMRGTVDQTFVAPNLCRLRWVAREQRHKLAAKRANSEVSLPTALVLALRNRETAKE